MSDQTTRPAEATLEQGSDHNESLENKNTTHFKSSSSGGIGSQLALLLALFAIGIASWPAYKIHKKTQLDAQVDLLVLGILFTIKRINPEESIHF